MKIGFICPTVPGHRNPMIVLARHLQARSHEVVFLYSSSANGLPYVAGVEGDGLNASRLEMSKLEGDSAIAFYSADIVERSFGVTKKAAATRRLRAELAFDRQVCTWRSGGPSRPGGVIKPGCGQCGASRPGN